MNFSVIIPNFNSPTIDKTIKSIELQNYYNNDYEVIVVGLDDLGLVKASDLVKPLCTNTPLTPAIARNRGVQHAQGKIIVFIDADCIAIPNWLSIYAERFTKPGVHVVGGGVYFEKTNYWTIADNVSMFYEFLSDNSQGVRSQLPSLNLAIRKDVFDKVGGFDERYPLPSGEDADLTIRLRLLGYLLYFEPRAAIIHSPTRNRLRDLLRHSYNQGKYSTKVDPRYSKIEHLLWPFYTRVGVILFSPILAAVATTLIFRSNNIFHKYWYTFPAILASKIAWCVGASTHPNFE